MWLQHLLCAGGYHTRQVGPNASTRWSTHGSPSWTQAKEDCRTQWLFPTPHSRNINSYVPPRPGLADSAAQAAQELFLHHGCAAGNRPWLWGGDFNEDFDESCAHTVAQQFQGSAVGPLHLLSIWKSKVTDLDLVFCNQLPLCSNVTNMTEVLGEHIAKSVTISHMATGFSQRDSPEQRLVETTAFHLQHNMDRNAWIHLETG